MFNVLIVGFMVYYFYKNNIRTGKLRQFMRHALPNVINYLQDVFDKIDGKKAKRHRSKYEGSHIMSVEEARQILGLKHGASKDEILGIFKKLMLINHPDKGGTEYIAAKIIQAKQTLLNDQKHN